MLILRERFGQTEVVTLNRPEAANSLNPPLMDELGIALQEILEDRTARAVVVTGAGDRVFCAGMDLATLGDWNDRGGSQSRPGADALAHFMGGTYPKPLIAAVNGAAVGGGLELVLACDLVVAAEDGRWFSGRSRTAGINACPPTARRWPHRGRSLLTANPPQAGTSGSCPTWL